MSLVRIAFLFEPAIDSKDCFNTISTEWLKGLVESQHQVKVITRRQTSLQLPPPHANLEWAEAMRNWAWWETPKLLSMIVRYSPQVVHVALGRAPALTSLWPALSALKGLNIPLVISPGDACTWPKQWRFYDQMISPPYTNHWAVPWLLPKNESFEISKELNTVFVPGPLSAHKNWQQSLETLMAYIQENPNKKYQLAWNFGEIPVKDRLLWRKRWQQNTSHADLQYLEKITPTEQLKLAQSSEVVFLELLQNPSWWRSCFDLLAAPKLEAVPHLPVDSAINQLARSYRTLSGMTKT